MTQRLTTFLCLAVITFYATMFVQSSYGPHGLLRDGEGRLQQTDYVSLWAAGRLALEGRSADAYDVPHHKQAMEHALAHEMPLFLPYSYPPPFFLVVAPLSTLPYVSSLMLFSILTLAMFAFMNARIIGRPEGALWMCATASTFWCFALGQSGALVSALLGAGLLSLPKRPALAGVAFGLMAVKPHFGLLVPVAQEASGQWRAFTAAAATVAVLALASLPFFGLAPWIAFPGTLGTFGKFVLADDVDGVYRLQSLFGILRTVGVGTSIAMTAQATLAIALVALIWTLWRRPGSANLKAAALAAAAPLASPYVFAYDLGLLAIAQAFLLRHALARGLTQAEIAVLAAVNFLVFVFPFANFPTGALASMLLLGAISFQLRSSLTPAHAPPEVLPSPALAATPAG